MYNNEHGRKIKSIMDNIISKNARHLDRLEEVPMGANISSGDKMNFDEISPEAFHQAKMGRKVGGKKSVAVYEPVEEETFEGDGAPRGNKNARTWIEHVKAYQAKHKCSYREALKGAKSSYVKVGKRPVKVEPVKVEPVKMEEPELRRGTRVRKPKVIGSGKLLLREQMKPSSMFGGGGKTSSWIQHVKNYSKTHGCSYKDALSKAKASYKK
jgi:hypothetical protein